MHSFIGFYVFNGLVMGFSVALTDFLHRNNPQHRPAPSWFYAVAAVLWPIVFALTVFFVLRRIVLLAWRGGPEEETQREEAQKGEHHDR